MRRLAFSSMLLCGIIGGLAGPRAASAATYKIIYELPGEGTTYAAVTDVLAADSLGRLYGIEGGAANTVFLLTPNGANKIWSEKTLYQFAGQPTYSPSQPVGGVTLVGNAIFGTTLTGGMGRGYMSAEGLGTAYRLDNGVGGLSLTTLHNFAGNTVSPPDGVYPESGLTPGLSGYLYGTTTSGTHGEPPTVFAVSPSTAKPGYEVIHRFGAPGDEAAPLHGRLWADSQGRLFGESENGGANLSGEVYMLQYAAGKWQEQVIYSFLPYPDPDLRAPVANVVLDSQGDVYGCAQYGTHGQGGIFELKPPAQQGGAWTETTLYNFGDAPQDPIAVATTVNGFGQEGCGITIDPATNILYGTSYGGGAYDYGTIFSLTPPAAGQTAWSESIIHSFKGNVSDGEYPVAPPLKVGSTYYGGNMFGVIYSFTP
jgi:uncharacterized repeat protein (TIGR03803 family)